MTVSAELEVCIDCFQGIVNDDFTALDYYHDSETAEKEEARIRAAIHELGPNVVPRDSEPDEFSTSPCDCCGSRLAGSRHGVAVLK